MSNEVYFSLDVEADGPIPGPNSMLSFGLAAYIEPRGIAPVQITSPPSPPAGVWACIAKFTRNLKSLDGASQDPSTMEFWAKNKKAYEATRVRTVEPAEAMADAVAHVDEISKELGLKPVCVGYPATYDFMWWHWYAIKFVDRDPFGFQAFDIKTAAMVHLGMPFRESTKKNYPVAWFHEGRHEHVAISDAVEQGILFTNLMNDVKTARRKLNELTVRENYDQERQQGLGEVKRR